MPCTEEWDLAVDLNLSLDVTVVPLDREIDDPYIVEAFRGDIDFPLDEAVFVRPERQPGRPSKFSRVAMLMSVAA